MILSYWVLSRQHFRLLAGTHCSTFCIWPKRQLQKVYEILEDKFFFFFLIHDNIIFMSTMSNWYNCTVFGWVIYRRSKLFIIHNYIKIHGNNKFTSKFILTLWLTHKSNKAEEEKREKREEKKKRRESLSYATSTFRRWPTS